MADEPQFINTCPVCNGFGIRWDDMGCRCGTCGGTGRKPDPADEPQSISYFVCPDCALGMTEFKPEQNYHPRATHWLCWRCDHRFGVTLDEGTLAL
jgi:hypothetical protein